MELRTFIDLIPVKKNYFHLIKKNLKHRLRFEIVTYDPPKVYSFMSGYINQKNFTAADAKDRRHQEYFPGYSAVYKVNERDAMKIIFEFDWDK